MTDRPALPPARRRRGAVGAAVAILLAAAAGPAGAAAPVRLGQPVADSLQALAFAVAAPVEVRIDAVGLVPRLGAEYAAGSWLLDAASRRPVWSLDARERETPAESRYLRRASDRVRLAPGTYVLYQFAGSRWNTAPPFRKGANILNDIADLISREDPRRDLPEYLARCFVEVAPVAGPPDALRPLPAPPPPPPAADAALVLGPAPSDSTLSRGFRLARAGTLRLRAFAEARRDTGNLYDTAWIEDATTAEPVWVLDPAAARWAGGSRKNRLFEGEVSLPAGDYEAFFATDGSHAWGSWNALPPPDPEAWGLTLAPGPGLSAGDLKASPAAAARRAAGALAVFRMVRDEEHRRQEFRLDRPARLRIEALAEGSGGDMDDEAWIVDLATGRRVWELKREQTEPAGGAAKNRRFSGVVELPAGRFEAHFRCDDSHAYGSWNAAPPPEPWRWGMTVRIATP